MMRKVNIDRVFGHIGELGPQQVKYCLLLSVLSMFNAQIMLQYTFVGHDMRFTCHLDEKERALARNQSSLANACPSGDSSRCESITFDTSSTSSINSEWNLVCDRAWLSPLTMSAFMTGVMIGALVLGTIADCIGRKRTLFVTHCILLITNAASGIITNYNAYIMLRFACGFVTSGCILANFVLLNELIGSSKRGIIGILTQAFFGIGIIVFSITAYFLQHWKHLTGASTAFGIPLVFLILWILPESPRWLQSRGKLKESLEVLKRIATGNRAKWDQRLISDSDDDESFTIQPHLEKDEKTDTLMSLLRNRYLRHITLIQIYAWLVNGMSYYGLTLAAGSDTNDKDLYWGTAMSGAVELPAYALAILSMGYFGRVANIAGYMIFGGVGMLLIPMVSTYLPFMSTSLALIGKLCISASFAIIYIHSNEIFPTSIRNSGMGLVSVAARIGGIASPYVSRMGSIFPSLHFIIFGVMSLTSGMLVIYLPDTKNVTLPETIRDLLSRRVHIVSVQSPDVNYKKIPMLQDQQ